MWILSYWITLALATFSDNPLSVTSELIFPLTLVLAFGLFFRLRREHLAAIPPDPLRPVSETTWQILKQDMQAPDLKWVVGVSALIFWLLWVGWGVEFAGDGASFMVNYLQLNDSDPVYFFQQIYWPPTTGIFYGGLLDLGGLPLVVLGQFWLNLTGAAAIYWMVRPFGRAAAWLMMVLWWTYLSHQVYFHLVGADPLMMWGVTGWLWALRLAMQHQKAGLWLLLGGIIGLNTLIRAGNLLMLVSAAGCVVPLIENLSKLTFKDSDAIYRVPTEASVGKAHMPSAKISIHPLSMVAKNGILAGLGFLALALPYMIYNGVRYDEFTLARGGNTLWFTATYLNDTSLVAPENGEASQKLARLVENYLLPTPTYEQITLDQFFTVPSARFWTDAIALIDRTDGWDTEYALLREVGFEAIRQHPTQFLRYRLVTLVRLLVSKDRLFGFFAENEAPQNVDAYTTLINRAHAEFLYSQPSGQLPSEAELAAIQAQNEAFIQPIRTHDGNKDWADFLGEIWLRFGLHPLLAWLVLPIALWGYQGRTRWFIIFALLGMLAVVGSTSMVALQLRYRLPFDALLVLILTLGLIRLLDKSKTNQVNSPLI